MNHESEQFIYIYIYINVCVGAESAVPGTDEASLLIHSIVHD